MKLTVFSPSYPPRTGGLETHAAEFNEALVEFGHAEHITVFTPLLSGFGEPRESSHPNIAIIRFPAFELIANYPFPKFWTREFRAAWREMHASQGTIVISRTRFFFTSIMAWYYARRTKKFHVHIEHGSDFSQLNTWWKSLAARLYDYTLGAFVLRHSDQNIAISEAVAHFIARFDRRPSPVIYRGVPVERLLAVTPDTAWRQQLPGYTLVTFVGRLIDGKGVADLLLAAQELVKEKIAFLIIGDGPQEQWLKQQAKEQKLTHMYFLGRKPVEAAVALVKASDIFINPSYTEGLPTSVIEAALSNVGIIATDVGGTREIITNEKTGVLIPPRNPSAIAAAIRRLTADGEYRKALAASALASSQKKFTWPTSAKAYHMVLAKLVQS